MKKILLLTTNLVFLSASLLAQELDSHEEKKLKKITVVGASASSTVPGSADLISGKELEQAKGGTDDINRVLKRIPGVNLTEEDGFGMRPNIGLRGVSSERSANITLMEDGVLIAPAPYSAPSAYFFPITGRMEGIEVLKGASQVKYGPRTTGGSLNLLSTSIPKEGDPKINLNAKGGSFDSLFAHFNAGQSYKNFGWLIETYQAHTDGFKDLDGGGDTGFTVEDYLGKFRLNSDKTADLYQELELKLGAHNNDADETYLGLTKSDFDKNPYRRYAASQKDHLAVDQSQVSLRHYAELSEKLDISTTGYYNNTKRAWNKLESINGQGMGAILDHPEDFADELAWIRGETNSPEDSLIMRDAGRRYGARGIQSVLGSEFETGKLEHDLELGLRYHYDYESRRQQEDAYKIENHSMILTSAGEPASQTNRKSEAGALALHAQDKIKYKDLTVTPGVRYESINLKYSDYGKKDPSRSGLELKRNYSNVEVFIPGIGTHYQLNDNWGTILGVHKGFAPPSPSADDNVKEEESVNYETGLIYTNGNFKTDATIFYNDYSNLLGADTLSGGGTGTGDLFNAGESTVYGTEASIGYDLADLLNVKKAGLPIYANYTFTNAEFDQSFKSSFFGDVVSGDKIPYIAENQAAAGTGVEFEKIGMYLNMFYMDSMPTAAGQTELRGGPKTDSHIIFDLNTNYKLKEDTSLFFVIENLFDEDYIAAYRPAGARPGRPLTFLAGFKINL